jgi:lipopolysaccharide export system permease protein
LRKLDKYILKKYLTSFIFTLLILVPVAIAIDVSEKIGKFLANADLTFTEIVQDYYVPFVVNYGNTFMPLALFIAVILFTSKLANDTEIVAIHSAGISFKRFLRPYIIGATIIAVFSLVTNHFVVPKTNGTFEDFKEAYLRKRKKSKTQVSQVNLQLNDSNYVYFRNFDLKRNVGYNFSYEKFEGLELKYKVITDNIKYNPEDSTYTLNNYKKRFIGAKGDSIFSDRKLDTTFNFFPKDLLYVDYLARSMTSTHLSKHIKISSKRGVKNLNQYKVELYKRTSLPISSFVLTIIAVALASKKRRGGVGMNLAVGIALMFIYVFFMKVAEVLGAGASSHPLFMVWLPNIVFGILAIYLYFNAKR